MHHKGQDYITGFFQFLNGKSEPESYDLLSGILEGKKTATELNYIPSGKVYKYYPVGCNYLAGCVSY